MQGNKTAVDSLKTRERLINATIELVDKMGADKVSLRKVATVCDVTHSAIYRHFESKGELLSAACPIIAEKLRRFIASQIELCELDQPIFITVCKAYLTFMVENPQYFYLFTGYPLIKEPLNSEITVFTCRQGGFAAVTQDYLNSCSIPKDEHMQMLHVISGILDGIASIVIKGLILVKGDYTLLVDYLIVRELKLR